jgi:hypothetical protein
MKLKYFFEKFKWMKVYFSPFKPPLPKLYIGKVAIGTPYFLPRVWDKDGKSKPKKIGFDFVGLGWKTKWEEYRFEWGPVWSFVLFKLQIAITFRVPETSHYWECWLYYSRETTGTTEERLTQAKKEFPCIWTSYKDGTETEICYWDVILKTKNYGKDRIK